MKVAFVCWNPFQMYHVESIAEHFEDYTFFIEKRKNINFERIFTNTFLSKFDNHYKIISRNDIKKIENTYDIVICQTEFGFMEKMKNTKIVGMQYSMSKERHQYGPWRSLCDLNLVYGKYSLEKISPFSPCIPVGNPRFDRYFSGNCEDLYLKNVLKLDRNKKTILYLPTWGNLSSIQEFINAIVDLQKCYNVIVKVHHKTDTHELDKKQLLKDSSIENIFGASDDLLYLLKCSDIVLSDYSGSIFDAIYTQKPVVLLQSSPESVVGAEKFGLESIEYRLRDQIGPVVDTPERLQDTVDGIIEGYIDFTEKNANLRSYCFAHQGNCGEIAANAIKEYFNHSQSRPSYQIYLRDVLRDARSEHESIKELKKLSKAHINKLYSEIKNLKSCILCKTFNFIYDRIHTFINIIHVRIYMFIKNIYVTIQRKCIKEISIALEKHTNSMTIPFSARWRAYCVPFLDLKALTQKYAVQDMKKESLLSAKLCYMRDISKGFMVYVNTLYRYSMISEISNCLSYILQLPVSSKFRFMSRLERTQELIKYTSLQYNLHTSRNECHSYVLENISGNQKRNITFRMIKFLISNRFLNDLEMIDTKTIQTKKQKKNIEVSLYRAKKRMDKWFFLTEIANSNHLPLTRLGEYLAWYEGKIVSISQVPARSVIEFFLPPYFYEEHVTEATIHDKIVSLLKSFLDILHEKHIAIVPRHQFKLDAAMPSGHWPAISYHTTGNMPKWFHIKDAPIPGYFSCDKLGYAGFSSLADMTSLPEGIDTASDEEIERTWEYLQQNYVATHRSKYAQTQSAFIAPQTPYIFFPLQVLDDTVARLAYIPVMALLNILMREVPARGYTLVVKRHPKCKHSIVPQRLAELAYQPGILVTDADIYDILPNASAVVTVNSGVGFEALLLGKHVICTGKTDYQLAVSTATTEVELQACLDRIGTPVDIQYIKRFLHFYIHTYLFQSCDTQRISFLIDAILSQAWQ